MSPAPPIGLPGPDGLRLRLTPREGMSTTTNADGGDPFVTLTAGALPYRIYLASLELAGGTNAGALPGVALQPYVALVLEPNELVGGRASLPTTTNEQVERAWGEAWRALGAGPFPGVAALAAGAGPGGAPVQPALAWCRKMDRYVEPACPGCLGRMTMCRDEALLRRSGLPSYRNSLVRFLYCPACAADSLAGNASSGRPATFYTFTLRTLEAPADGVRVRRRGELCRDLAPRILSGEAPTSVDNFCFQCPERTNCYPAGRRVDEPVPAEGLLFPLAYTDCHYQPLEPLPLTFDETAALLGGASVQELEGRRFAEAGARPTVLREAALRGLAPDRPQFFFEGDDSGLMALEALYLKLAAFAEVTRGVRDLHARARRPHLALAPERLRGAVAGNAGLAPPRWALGLKLADLVSTAPLAALEADAVAGEPTVWAAPYPLHEAYAPEAMARVPSDSLFMRLSVTHFEVERLPDGRGVAHLAGEVVSDGYREIDHGQYDLVRLSSQAASSGPDRVVFAGRRVGVVTRGFLFEGRSAPLAPEALRTLEAERAAVGQGGWSVEATIVRTFHEPADVLSLGLLLLRLLLVNDRVEGTVIDRDTIDRIVAGLEDDGAPGAPGGEETARALFKRELVLRRRLGEVLAREGLPARPESVLYREADRTLAAARGAAPIPPALWEETLLLGLKMASNRAGFSICRRQDDYDAGRPGALLTTITDEIDLLAERARGALVGAGGRNRLVLEVCADFLTDLTETASATAPGGVEDSVGGTVVLSPGRGPG